MGGYDTLAIEDAAGNRIETLHSTLGEVWSEVIPGTHASLHFTSNDLFDGWGFAIDKVQYLP